MREEERDPMATEVVPPPAKLLRPRRPQIERARLNKREGLVGWGFATPALIGLLLFTALPIVAAVWVSFRQWNGISPIFDTDSVGFQNYRDLLIRDGVRRTDFAIALRNNLYYVLGVVPAQTILSFVLAVIVNQKFLRGKGFFRTAYYFPSITSSIAITLIFVFLFQINGAINAFLPFQDVNWLNNPRGLIHNFLGVLGVDGAPSFLADNDLLGLSLWNWLAGPSVAMTAIMMLVTWTTVGTMMLIFLAGLQSIPPAVEEAAMVDGASATQRFWRITVPMMRPTLFFVITLGLISTWQVFDQIYAGTFGDPRKTTTTPAFWIYFQGFTNSQAGLAAAIAVILFVIIMIFTVVNRVVIRDRGEG
jgi:multiple sugar transport system permease protein